MMMRPRAALALASTVTAASAQSVTVSLSDRLEQPSYARAWTAMLAGQRLPPWLANKAKGANQDNGKRAVIEGRDAELYYACQPHDCGANRFEVMFYDRGARAKGVLVVGGRHAAVLRTAGRCRSCRADPGSAVTPDAAILSHLAARSHATAAEVGIACRFAAAEVRTRLVSLESRRLVASRQDKATGALQRVYYATAEGRREAGVSDARG